MCGDNTVLSFVFLYNYLFHNALTTCVYTITSVFYMYCGHFRTPKKNSDERLTKKMGVSTFYF